MSATRRVQPFPITQRAGAGTSPNRAIVTLRQIFLMLAAPALGATAAMPQRAGRQPPVITAFALDDGAAVTAGQMPVVLTHTVVGATPSEYRVSARADFARAVWQAK